MKWLAIINPKADHHTRDQWRQLSEDLQFGLGADVIWTTYPGHARTLARQYARYEGFIAVGGDGTIAEVLNGLDPARHRLGVVPAGTANGLARDLGVPDEPSALRALRRSHFELIDLVSVAYRTGGSRRRRTMLNTSAIGYVACATATARHPCKKRGAWVNAVAAVVECFRQKEFSARLRLDDGPWQALTLTNLVVHNTPHIGQFCLFPEADAQDARFDILYGRVPVASQLTEDLGVLTRTYFYERSLRRQACSAEVQLATPMVLMIDGDLVPGVDAIKYRILPRRLSCATARKSPHREGKMRAHLREGLFLLTRL